MSFLDCFNEICLWLRENTGKTRLLLMRRDEGKPMVDNGNGRDTGFEHLSDDLLIKILMRLPAEQLWRSGRRVCTRWKALISCPYFRQLHLQQAPSTFFVYFFRKASEKMKIFFPRDDDVKASPLKDWVLDGSLVKSWKRIENSYEEVYPVHSCNGLVLFETHSRDKMYIGNPITGGLMTIKKPYPGKGLFGFYYYPKKKQYKVLICRQNSYGEYPYEYLVYFIRDFMWRSLGLRRYHVRKQPPVIVNNSLYWMIASECGQCCEKLILKFFMDSERFCTLPHPSGRCQPTQMLSRHRKIDLLEMDSRLACICSWGIVSTLWVLESPERSYRHKQNRTEYWSPLYSLDFGLFPFSNVHAYDDSEIQFVSIQNTELLLVWQRRGAFRYNLLTDAVTKVELDIGKFQYKEGTIRLTGYTKSMVMLTDFFPTSKKYQLQER